MQLNEFLVAWRTTVLHDREVVDALVHPAHAALSPELARELNVRPPLARADGEDVSLVP